MGFYKYVKKFIPIVTDLIVKNWGKYSDFLYTT